MTQRTAAVVPSFFALLTLSACGVSTEPGNLQWEPPAQDTNSSINQVTADGSALPEGTFESGGFDASTTPVNVGPGQTNDGGSLHAPSNPPPAGEATDAATVDPGPNPSPADASAASEDAATNDPDDAGTGDPGNVDQDAGGDVPTFIPDLVCTSGNFYRGGGGDDDGSPTMNPGMACNDCHRRSREAPIFSIAGTVYPTLNEPDNCYGVNGLNAGMQIKITGANGAVLMLAPNAAGNFYSQNSVAFPAKAALVYGGMEIEMFDPITAADGDCNSCHSEYGTNGPGRISP